ncbi:YybH family protein [Piscinibacter koreensis]|uniref:Nuclear transport factor 2 family protein n=1 Tax=Piscinibacter koreensis TaxID=2742824 RepID=A0A7Y6TX93_9BURK|nr:nuclear transport factor 2 family protein [Schlegelella koreensis]NUZ06830.1 nuclear transport factor 2 family protein [Schlegelella koreensis]
MSTANAIAVALLIAAALPAAHAARAGAAAGTAGARSGPATAAPGQPTGAHSAAECEVWRRETQFARSVEHRHRAAFAEHVHPGAVFDAGGPQPLRGRDAIVTAWTPLIAGRGGSELRWRAGFVSIGDNADVAVVRGPYELRERGVDGRPRYRVGLYQSVWVRDGAGAPWLVLYRSPHDASMQVANAAEAQAFADAHAALDCTTE